jgi:uncharacterized membrane-anchored protein YhcB (DUF1043 family)
MEKDPMATGGWFEHLIGAVIGACVGWVISSFTKASRSELTQLQIQLETDLERLEAKLESKMDRQEFRDAVSMIQTQLAQINSVLMRRTRDPM